MFLKLSRTGVKLHFIDSYFFGMKLTASKRHDKLSNWYRTDKPQKLRKRTEWRGGIYRDNKQRNLGRFFIVALFNKATKEAEEKERKCLSWLCGSQWREEVKVCL